MSLPGYRFSSDFWRKKSYRKKPSFYSETLLFFLSLFNLSLLERYEKKRGPWNKTSIISTTTTTTAAPLVSLLFWFVLTVFSFVLQCSVVCVCPQKRTNLSLSSCIRLYDWRCVQHRSVGLRLLPLSLGPCVVVSLWMSNCGAPTVVETRLFRANCRIEIQSNNNSVSWP